MCNVQCPALQRAAIFDHTLCLEKDELMMYLGISITPHAVIMTCKSRHRGVFGIGSMPAKVSANNGGKASEESKTATCASYYISSLKHIGSGGGNQK